MKPALPDKFTFVSPDGKFTLTYVPNEDPIVRGPKVKWVWKGARPVFPSEVILAPKADLAFFLGGLGDPGFALGVVDIHELSSGKLLRQAELTRLIPDMEARSRAFRDSTNFPWISKVTLDEDGQSITIRAFDELTIRVAKSSEAIVDAKPAQWFSRIGCERLRVVEYDNMKARVVRREVTIADPEYIRSLQASISQLPTSGEKMVEMGEDANYLTLEFTCGARTELVEFYNSRIKTPSHSFFVSSMPEPKALWKEAQDLLGPATLGVKTPFYVGRVLDFGAFQLTYLGSEDRTPAGVTATLIVQTFSLRAPNERAARSLEIRSGQLPPRPLDFTVEGKSYTLSTFVHRGERLHPRFLVVGPTPAAP